METAIRNLIDGAADIGKLEHREHYFYFNPREITKSVVVNRPPDEAYRFWRNFENLPRFMKHLESVVVVSDRQSQWVARAPLLQSVEWIAEIISEVPNHFIAWRSMEGSQIRNAGWVRFDSMEGGTATEVTVNLSYVPPCGKLGAAVAKFFGEEPEVQCEEDLRRFKEVLEGAPVAAGLVSPLIA